MSDKLYQYEGTHGILRSLKNKTKQQFNDWRDDRSCFLRISNYCCPDDDDDDDDYDHYDYSHIYR